MIKVSELFLVCGLVGVIPFAANKLSQEPDGYIPMWSQQKKGHQTSLINTRQIVRITPVFDPDLVLSKTRNPKADYLEVLLSTGELLIVDEEYEDFKKRVRNSR